MPFDPSIYFFGDEVLTGVRAFTCGYDLFHPHVVVGWHCYDRGSRTPHWDDHPEWADQHRRSLDRMRNVLRAGLGKARSLADYEDLIALSLIEPT